MTIRLLLVTALYPCGEGESFLEDEIDQLGAAGMEVTVLPVQFDGGVPVQRVPYPAKTMLIPIYCGTNILRSLAWAAKHPLIFFRILGLVLSDPRHLVKNIAVMPKAIRIGEEMCLDPPSHIHAHWMSTSATTALIISVITKVPFSVTAHRWDIVDDNLMSIKVRKALFVRVISDKGREALIQRVSTFPGKIKIVHLGVTAPPLLGHLMGSQDGDCFRMICPANLVGVKGHAYLLEAVAILRSRGVKTHLDIVGSGPLEAAIQRQIATTDISDIVVMQGFIPRPKLLLRYAQGMYDAVVLPSLDLGGGIHEGIPASLMEAMSYGIAPISTITGGIPELIEDSENGLLVRDKDAIALANAIERYQRDPPFRERLGLAAQLRVRDDFSASAAALRLKSLMLGEGS